MEHSQGFFFFLLYCLRHALRKKTVFKPHYFLHSHCLNTFCYPWKVQLQVKVICSQNHQWSLWQVFHLKRGNMGKQCLVLGWILHLCMLFKCFWSVNLVLMTTLTFFWLDAITFFQYCMKAGNPVFIISLCLNQGCRLIDPTNVMGVGAVKCICGAAVAKAGVRGLEITWDKNQILL